MAEVRKITSLARLGSAAAGVGLMGWGLEWLLSGADSEALGNIGSWGTGAPLVMLGLWLAWAAIHGRD